MIEPYRFANGETYGSANETPLPARTYEPPIQLSLGERARLARRRREVDPEWGSRSKESRDRLLTLDAREARGLR